MRVSAESYNGVLMPYRAPDGTLQDVLPLVESETGIGVIPVEVSDVKGEFGTAPGAIPARIVSGPYLDADGTLQEPIPIMIDGSGYDPDAEAFFERLTTPPTTERKALYNTLIVDLKSAGVWEKLDALYILAAADAQAARQNLVAGAYNLTAVGSPLFTADRGYAGDGVGAYLTTGLTPSGAGNYKLTSAHMSMWSRSDIVSTAATISAPISAISARNALASRYSGNNADVRLNTSVATALAAGAAVSNLGFSCASRAGTTVSLEVAGVSAQSTTTATHLPDGAFTLLADSVNATMRYWPGQLASMSCGGALTTQERDALRVALNAYLVTVGAA